MIKIEYEQSLDEYFQKFELSLKKIKKSKLYKSSQIHQEFVKYLEHNLKLIICGKPNKLRKHIDEINSYSINFILHRKFLLLI